MCGFFALCNPIFLFVIVCVVGYVNFKWFLFFWVDEDKWLLISFRGSEFDAPESLDLSICPAIMKRSLWAGLTLASFDLLYKANNTAGGIHKTCLCSL